MDTVVESWDAIQTGVTYAREWLTWAATSIWAAVPGNGVDQKLRVLGTLAAIPALHWLWQKWRGTDINTQVDKVDEKVDRLDTKVEKLTAVLIAQAREREASLPGSNQPGAAQLEEEVEKGIAAAVKALAKSGKEAALEALKRGETGAADEALAEKIGELEETQGVAGREAADLYRQRGAIAFLHDTQAALRFYGKATELDPDDAEGWNVLGLLQLRAGYLDAAIENFERVLALGNSTADQAIVAAAKDNLGIVYRTRGDLNAAEAMHKEALALNEALGCKQGMAKAYTNLGIVYRTRGDLSAAEAMHKKSLDLDEALGCKHGMANDYTNFGNVYRTRGDLSAAEAMAGKLKKAGLDHLIKTDSLRRTNGGELPPTPLSDVFVGDKFGGGNYPELGRDRAEVKLLGIQLEQKETEIVVRIQLEQKENEIAVLRTENEELRHRLSGEIAVLRTENEELRHRLTGINDVFRIVKIVIGDHPLSTNDYIVYSSLFLKENKLQEDFKRYIAEGGEET